MELRPVGDVSGRRQDGPTAKPPPTLLEPELELARAHAPSHGLHAAPVKVPSAQAMQLVVIVPVSASSGPPGA